MEYFRNRRTHRHFTDRHIDSCTLQQIVEMAMKAPTTGNMQLYSIIASHKGESRKELEALHFNQPAATSADILLTVCADFYRFTRWCKACAADPGYDNFLSFTSAMTDAVIVAQQIVTIAEMQGLGSCYLGTVTYNAPEIARLLNLPPLTVPVGCLALGYPAGESEPTERLGTEAVLFDEKYPTLSDEEIMTLFKAKDDYAPNRKYIEENGKQTLAQVFTDIRYPRQMNEATSAKLLDFIRQAGFLDKE